MTERMLHAGRRKRRTWTTAAATCLLGHSHCCCSRRHVPSPQSNDEKRCRRNKGRRRPLGLAALTRWRCILARARQPCKLVVVSLCKIISRREANIRPSTTVHRFFSLRYPFQYQQLSSIVFTNQGDSYKHSLAVQQPPQKCAEPSKHARLRCPRPCPLPLATSSPTAHYDSTALLDHSSLLSNAACTSHRCSEMRPPPSQQPSPKMSSRFSQNSKTFKTKAFSTATLSRI
jgi:hypothetical protein